MTRMRTKAAGAGVAVLLGMGGAVALATSSGAQGTTLDDPSVEAPPFEELAGEVDEVGEEGEAEGCDWLDGDLSEEDLAELQTELEAEADAMIDALDAAGVEYELVADDELGISFPEPTGDDEASWEAFEDALTALWAEEFAALPADEQAEIVEMEQQFATELLAALDEAGIAYELETDPVTGVEFPVFDEDDEAAWEALDALEDELWSMDDHEDVDDGEPEEAAAA